MAAVHIETLEQVAERLDWSQQRLDEARARGAAPRPSKVTARDRARAVALSDSVDQTRRALDEAS